VINCSVAALELRVRVQEGEQPRMLRTAHGGVYELGMRERDHGVPIAPFPDGSRAEFDRALTPIKTTHSPPWRMVLAAGHHLA
jgi:hypothetical protein